MAGLTVTLKPSTMSSVNGTQKILTITAPTNQRLKIRGFQVHTSSTSTTGTPIALTIARASSISGGTAYSGSDSMVITNDNDAGETPQVSGSHGNVTATLGDVIWYSKFPPIVGEKLMVPFDQQDRFIINGGDSIAFQVVTGESLNIDISVCIEE